MSILFFSSQIIYIYIYIKVRDYPIISLKKKNNFLAINNRNSNFNIPYTEKDFPF